MGWGVGVGGGLLGPSPRLATKEDKIFLTVTVTLELA